MSKPKFSIGEFVYSANHKHDSIFYIYNYRKGYSYPYGMLSLRTGIPYRAHVKSLKAVESITDILNLVTGNSIISFTEIKKRAARYKTRNDSHNK